ncbi:MAG: radical SAM protein [Candidatus Nanoarchaeia archaeon]|nr:radical SAM protein [Candidatus Nanoarchaeia archaeon]
MNILIIYPTIGNTIAFNHGVGSISAILKEGGHNTKLIIPQTENYNEIKKEIKEYKPEIILLSFCSNYWSYIKYISKRIKNEFDIPIFAGGPHTTLFPECIYQSKHIDGICIGEGEMAIKELINKIKKGGDYIKTKNFWFRKGEKIIKNELRPLIENLDILPIPDRSIFSKKIILKYPNFNFSRGCPYSCSYCCNNKLNELYKGKIKIIRFKSVKKALEEINQVVKEYNLPELIFDDDSFTKDPEWLLEFCKRYRERFTLSFSCNTRPELFNEEIAQTLKNAGCKRICIGIESGDEEFRKKYLNRYMSNKKIIEAFNIAKKYKIKATSFNMIGMPFETEKSFKKTIELNKLLQPEEMQLSIYYPYIGTELGDLCFKNGLITKRKSNDYMYDSILDLPEFPRKKVIRYAKIFHYLVYKDKNIKKAIYYLIRKQLLFSVFYKYYNLMMNKIRLKF